MRNWQSAMPSSVSKADTFPPDLWGRQELVSHPCHHKRFVPCHFERFFLVISSAFSLSFRRTEGTTCLSVAEKSLPNGQRQDSVVKERLNATKVARFLGKLRNDMELSV
jgi:hypothetical protein